MAIEEGGQVEFVNKSGIEAGWTLGLQRDGREVLIVAAKATYTLPVAGEEPALAQEQAKLVLADEFTGEPGLSAPLRETDYSPRKLQCDVVLNGSAYAPGRFPASSVNVSLRVGSMLKSFFVFGERRYEDIMLSTSDPDPFLEASISYNGAYGGADFNEDEPDKVATYVENPVGTGYHPIRRRSLLIGQLLPNTAESGRPITDVTGRHRPMAFGPVGRNFSPRYRYAGTYDAQWLNNESPFWPADFSYEYFQCAPEDQQVEFLQGGEEVELTNLTPDGRCRFRMPHRRVPVTCVGHRGGDVQVDAVCDTLLLEPDLSRFSLTWRASIPLQRNLFEMRQTIVGDLPYSWHSRRRAERAGKRYYTSLAEAVENRGGRGRP
jgi:hypothetical protein